MADRENRNEARLAELRAYFGDDNFATRMLGIEIEAADAEGAVCSLELKPEHYNSQGTAQGGAIFTLADFAFAVASNARAKGTVTLQAAIHYLRPGTGARLRAVARRVGGGAKTCVYEVRVSDEAGRGVALMTATGYTKERYTDKSKAEQAEK